MDNSLLTWPYYSQPKMESMEELKQWLLYTTMELEQTKAAAQEELRKRDNQLLTLRDLLNKALRERDQAQHKCQALLFQQQQTAPPNSAISSIEEDDHPRNRAIASSNNNNNGVSSSDCEESIVSSPPVTEYSMNVELAAAAEKPLPEKGKLLQAVMKAGPLLQTLLLAGPLPEWRHPPPPLDSFQIPPVTIPSPPNLIHQDSFVNNTNGRVSGKKRAFCDGSDSDSAIETKCQRVVLH